MTFILVQVYYSSLSFLCTCLRDYIGVWVHPSSGTRSNSHSGVETHTRQPELVIKLVRNIPGKDEDEILNIWNSYIWTAEWRIENKEDPRSY